MTFSRRGRSSGRIVVLLLLAGAGCAGPSGTTAGASGAAPRACIDPSEPGWVALGGDDFVNVNCPPETWDWRGGFLHCTGQVVGVTRSRRMFTNFELSLSWRHLKPAGNSGVFVWAPEGPLKELPPNKLPSGIEVQVLDLAFAADYEKKTGKKGDWFTTQGDVFPVGVSKMTPFPPTSPNGSRSFPRKERTKGAGEWNHYYIRCVNGEVRLWVNGEETSGGRDCEPRTGYLCLESEGSPVEFRDIRIRELP
jgi:hypothetical protein